MAGPLLVPPRLGGRLRALNSLVGGLGCVGGRDIQVLYLAGFVENLELFLAAISENPLLI